MLFTVRRRLPLLVALVVACAPIASSPSPTPAATAASTVTPAGSAVSPTPTASSTPIPLPSTAQLAAAGKGVIWALVADAHLFVSTDTGNTWDERTVPTGAGQLLIAFVNGRDGFAARLDSPGTQCQQQNYQTFSTIDGARTWQGLSAAFDTGQCKANLAFVDTQHGYMT